MFLFPRRMSMGLSRKKSVSYSTNPSALRGASARSVISEFDWSAGSTVPRARPTNFPYCPVRPKDSPSKVGDSTRSINSSVIRPWAGLIRTTSARITASRVKFLRHSSGLNLESRPSRAQLPRRTPETLFARVSFMVVPPTSNNFSLREGSLFRGLPVPARVSRTVKRLSPYALHWVVSRRAKP